MAKDIRDYILPAIEDLKEIERIISENDEYNFGETEIKNYALDKFFSMYDKINAVYDELKSELDEVHWDAMGRLRFLLLYRANGLRYSLVYGSLKEYIPPIRIMLEKVK